MDEVDISEVMSDNNTIDYLKLKEVSSKHGCNCGEMLTRLRKNRTKGIIALYGNCQTIIYARIVKSSLKMMDSYILLWFGPVQEIHGEEEKAGFEKELIENIDVLIYQEVVGNTSISKALNTKDIVRQMRKDAVSVCIPNIYFEGYFPQYCGNRYDVFYFNTRGVLRPCFPYGDKNIEKYTRGAVGGRNCTDHFF